MGYNADDRISASQFLKYGYGECNTKGTLLIALFRVVGISSHFHVLQFIMNFSQITYLI
nr:hypothetical protein [Pseudoalteromonas sp. C2R02]